jgi:hypothetical protein
MKKKQTEQKDGLFGLWFEYFYQVLLGE